MLIKFCINGKLFVVLVINAYFLRAKLVNFSWWINLLSLCHVKFRSCHVNASVILSAIANDPKQ